MGDKKEASLKKTITDKQDVISLFSKNRQLDSLLTEFAPKKISAGIYNYRGITIYMGVAEFENADKAFGIYSGLTSQPRDRWKHAGGELSYRHPFVSGYKGRCAFWFYSPSHPANYFYFYVKTGKSILSRIGLYKKSADRLSYHWKILPEANRYRDSAYYIDNREISGFDIENAYAAKYRAGKNDTDVYVLKTDSDSDSVSKYRKFYMQMKDKYVIKPFNLFTGGPGEGFYSYRDRGFCVVYRYKWMIFIIHNVPELKNAQSFLRDIYRNMMKIRSDVMPAQKKSKASPAKEPEKYVFPHSKGS